MKKLATICLACFIFLGCTSTAVTQEDKMKEENPKKELEIGNVNHFTYKSEFCGMERGVNVLLPADYDESKKYKVIYYLHGIFGNEYSISGDQAVQVRQMTAQAAADGKEFIVVFPDMFARKDFNQKPGFDDAAVKCYDDFINDLVGDLMPWVKRMFSIEEGRENTAICGFSMGGRESLFIGLTRPDLFGYVGAFAPAPGLVSGKDYAMNHPGQLEEKDLTFADKEFQPIYFQICCGTVDTVVGQFPKNYHIIFEKNGQDHVWFEVVGAGHDAGIMNPGFEKFVENIFE